MSFLSTFAQSTNYYDYADDLNAYNSADAAATTGMTLGILLFSLVLSAIIYVIYAFFLSKIFKKAGVEGWKAWVPIYNTWVMLELGGQKGFWAILSLVPIVNIVASVFMYIAMYHIGLKFGKEGWFIVLAVFLPLVWLIWLAVDKSVWQGGSISTTATTPPTNQNPPQVPPQAPTYTPPTM